MPSAGARCSVMWVCLAASGTCAGIFDAAAAARQREEGLCTALALPGPCRQPTLLRQAMAAFNQAGHGHENRFLPPSRWITVDVQATWSLL